MAGVAGTGKFETENIDVVVVCWVGCSLDMGGEPFQFSEFAAGVKKVLE